MRYFILIFIICFVFVELPAQSFTTWIVGDSTDILTDHQSGIVLAGGGGDNDDAMRWLLERADEGDVVVIRASGSDGYNQYLFEDLGINVNSVRTIRFDNRTAAFDPEVIRYIKEAEVLFIAGGDQTVYQRYWQDTPVQEAIQFLVNEKKVSIGGTSAGAAIMGGFYYAPQTLGVISSEALNDPYHPYMDSLFINDFLHIPYLQNVIVETHFDQRERAGRLSAMLARLVKDYDVNPKAIALNEYVAVGIDGDGKSWVFGEHPEYPDYAYFLQPNCTATSVEPEVCESGQPLTWNIDGSALATYKIGGVPNEQRYFDLNTWNDGIEGTWESWFVDKGTLQMSPALSNGCIITSVDQENLQLNYTNPVTDMLRISSHKDIVLIELYDLRGHQFFARLQSQAKASEVNLQYLPSGLYLMKLTFDDGSLYTIKVIKE